MGSQTGSVEVAAPIHPRSIKGRFRTLKYAALALAFGVYFGFPWLRWMRDIGPDQAVLFDIDGRRFYLFNLIVHPQDMFWLAGILMIAALLLFFVTSVAGRVFCGYFCVQTLWTDTFMRIEHWIQGERPARLRLEKQPWNGEKIVKKGLTHLIWLSIAFVTGITFTLYWGNAPEMVGHFFSFEASFAMYATTAFLTLMTYLMAGLTRENVCFYMCPYSRFQSAMFDSDTLIVSYDFNRGEGDKGRAKLGRGKKTLEERSEQGMGDCIDCGYCVQVCPVGIDIRDGAQAECIHCALCVDACDAIMATTGWDKGLIRYTSENDLTGKKTRFFKPRSIIYALALLGCVGLLSWSVSSQTLLDVAIRQIRQPLFVTLSDGRIQNSYEVKVNNKTTTEQRFNLLALGLEGAELNMGRMKEVVLEPDSSLRFVVRVRMPRGNQYKSQNFQFQLISTENSDLQNTRPAMFYRPSK